MGIIFNQSGTRIRGYTAAHDFSYFVTEKPFGAGTTPSIQTDSNINTVTGAENNFQVHVVDSNFLSGHTLINNTPSIITLDGNGDATRLQNGLASIDIATPVGRRNYSRIMSTSSIPKKAWQSFVAGSLGKHIVDSMLALISGKTVSSTTHAAFTSNNYLTATPAVVRNPNLYCAALNLTGISVMGAGGNGYIHPGMLISPRHVIGATHFHGTGPWVWLGTDGQYHSASLAQGYAIANTDIWIGYLNASISNCAILKVLPANYINYLPNADGDLLLNLPILSKTAHSGTPAAATGAGDWWTINHILMLIQMTGNKRWFAYQRFDSDIAALPTEAWHVPIVGGDSGSPLFILINGELVLIGAHLGAVTGDTYSNYITEIEAAMNSLGAAQGDMTSYSLNKVDLSAFTSY